MKHIAGFPNYSWTALVCWIVLKLLLWYAIPLQAELLPVHGRALSLSELQARAQSCAASRHCEQAITQLASLSRVSGFVVDRINRDVVLFGQVDPAQPQLHLEDFIIAMRDTWGRYGVRRGNTVFVTAPGVSIDPYPQVIEQLQRVGDQLGRSPSAHERQRNLDSWHRTCHQPQAVRVESVPFTSRFAAVMLQVDYELKRLASGADDPGIEGFTSLADLHLAAAKQALERGDNEAPALSSMSRFWFYPRPLRVRADPDTALIAEDFGLLVLTEAEHLDAHGQITGSGAAHPLAARWAQQLSRRYGEIAAQRPGWRDLENLAWTVALARTLRAREAFTLAGLDITWLLDRYPLPTSDVPKTIPGHSNVGSYQYRKAIEGGYLVGSLLLPSCGGVQLDIRVDRQNITPSGPHLKAMSAQALKRRPTDKPLYWDF